MPQISIILPVYNVELYLNKGLSYLSKQTLKDIEIILVNDGSTDNSAEICKLYELNDSRFKYFETLNQGAAKARNFGITKATAPYLIFLDADDWMEIDTCEKAFELAKLNDLDMVFWSFNRVYQNTIVKENSIFDSTKVLNELELTFFKRRICGLLKEELNWTMSLDYLSMPWAKLIKKEIIEKNNITFFDRSEVGSEDTLFNFYLFQKLQKVGFINEPLNFYRQDNPNSLTKTDIPKLMPRFLNMFNYMEAYIVKEKLNAEYIEALFNRIALSTIGVNLFIVNKRNKAMFFEKIEHIKEVLNNEKYKLAYKKLELRFLPIHWKIFFYLCKNKCVLSVYFLSNLMNKLRKSE